MVLARIEDMREHAVVFPTSNGGCHTLWVLGHLAFIEALVVRTFMRGESNPLGSGSRSLTAKIRAATGAAIRRSTRCSRGVGTRAPRRSRRSTASPKPISILRARMWV